MERKTDFLWQKILTPSVEDINGASILAFSITSAADETETSAHESQRAIDAINATCMSCKVRVDLQQVGGVLPFLRRLHLLTALKRKFEASMLDVMTPATHHFWSGEGPLKRLHLLLRRWTAGILRMWKC